MTHSQTDSSMLSLNGTWKLWFTRDNLESIEAFQERVHAGWQSIDAEIPGNVELDLQRAGFIPDPMTGSNVYEILKWENHHYWYQYAFKMPDWKPDGKILLVFEGLDCFATIWIDNHLAGRTSNALIPHQIDVTEQLKPNQIHQITIRLKSALQQGRQYKRRPDEYALAGKWEAQHVRKAPHSYGWDIMPRIVSAGIWRDMYLKIQPSTRFESVYWATQSVDIQNHTASLVLDYDIHSQTKPDNWSLEITLASGKGRAFKQTVPVHQKRNRLTLNIDSAYFWWPRNFGDAALYEARLNLLNSSGQRMAFHQSRIGIRTLELRRTNSLTDSGEGKFSFIINGEAVFIKGSNWVALDAFHSRDRGHLNSALDMLEDLNCNMVRCWGGNVYEADPFFDRCDETGILVWQDFASACCRPPQTDELAGQMKIEAESVIFRLRNHPCLALWAGNNENDIAPTWDGRNTNPATERISRDILPDAVQRLDPCRPYLASSPYVSPEIYENGFDNNAMPENHLWGPRGYFKDDFYSKSPAKFVSEVGYHGCPDRESLEQMLDSPFVYPWNKARQWNTQWLAKAVAAHPDQTQFANDRNNLMIKQIKAFMGNVPENLDDFILASQITQAEAMKYFIEFWRQRKGETTGILWWNLRDGWPILSDSVVDYYFRKKLAYDYIKRVQADVCVMIGEQRNGKHPVIAVNDTLSEQTGSIRIIDADSAAILLETDYIIKSNGILTLPGISSSVEPKMALIQWTDSAERVHFNHYLSGKGPVPLCLYKTWLSELTAMP